MSVKFISPEEFDLLFETLQAVNPNVRRERVANILRIVSVANQAAYISSYDFDTIIGEVEPWKPQAGKIECKPAIPAFCDGSLLRWVDNLIYNCIDQEGTCFLPERIQNALHELLPAYELRNGRGPGARTSEEWVERGEEDCLSAIEEGHAGLAAVRAIWLHRVAHLQHLNVLGIPESSSRRKTAPGRPEYHPYTGIMTTPLIEVRR